MPYLVDGHNLIPKTGLRLDSPDDEMELVQMLQNFARLRRKEIEVYFDGAPAGQAGTRRFGKVEAHFITHRSSADTAIRHRLLDLGRSARNWIVVSSDRAIVKAAAHSQADTMKSEAFAELLRQATDSTGENKTPLGREAELSDLEVTDWLDIFKKR